MSKIEVPTEPHFDEEGAAYFHDRIATCTSYLEYGSGGSTVAIAKKGVPFTTVDSDRRFLSAVKAKVREATGFTDGRFVAVNIGMVREWGNPLFTDLTPRRAAKWKSYPLAPWPTQSVPEVVLIDGRFRVACALVSIRNLYEEADFEILFDDYRDRPYYHAIERFAQLHSMHGRMAVFKQRPISLSTLDAAIEKFSTDYR